jgi:undecaprenyl-diphosphatase
MQKLFGITEEGLILPVVLHLGTSLALVVFFFQDILEVFRNLKLLSFIIIATIITGIIGISGRDFFAGLFMLPRMVAMAWLVTGMILILTRKFMDGKRNIVGMKDALIFGLMQGLAIIPGISRSGVTLCALLFRRIDRETSFRFSFLASIPVVFGAAILEAKDIGLASKLNLGNFAVGFIFSFFSGIVALRILKIILRKAKLHYFGYYCIFVAIITLLFIK